MNIRLYFWPKVIQNPAHWTFRAGLLWMLSRQQLKTTFYASLQTFFGNTYTVHIYSAQLLLADEFSCVLRHIVAAEWHPIMMGGGFGGRQGWEEVHTDSSHAHTGTHTHAHTQTATQFKMFTIT